MVNNILDVKDLVAGYGGMPVLQRVSLALAPGESVAIVGANGAGKSTLVKTLCGLLRASAGSIIKSGAELADLPPHARVEHGVAVVLEGRHLFGELSVLNNLNIALNQGRRRQVTKRFELEDAYRLFPFLGARLNAPVELLSGGEQQMVAVARALLLQPDLLIMDEPSTGLAPKVVKEIVHIIDTLRAQGLSILLIEQNAALAAETTDRAYIMSVGKIVHAVKTGEWQDFLNDDQLVKSYFGG
jgi:ABC-type branched-subunit amino acid transport system ATPase component